MGQYLNVGKNEPREGNNMPDLYKKGKKVGHISYDQPQGEIDAKARKARKAGLDVRTNTKGLKGRNAGGNLYGTGRQSSRSRRSRAY